MELTAKEKAKELVDKFQYAKNYSNSSNAMSESLAKQCALIAVDEIMRVCPYINEKKRETVAQLEAFDFQFVSYWQQVKKEINNL
jgi:hypothetical protein